MKKAPSRPTESGQLSSKKADPGADWQADWEGHRRWQLTSGLAATPAQRLAWLEEMLELAHQSGALPGRLSQERGGAAPSSAEDEGDVAAAPSPAAKAERR